MYTTKRSQFPPPHQQAAYTNLTVLWPGAGEHDMFPIQLVRGWGCSEGWSQKPGSVVWGDERLCLWFTFTGKRFLWALTTFAVSAQIRVTRTASSYMWLSWPRGAGWAGGGRDRMHCMPLLPQVLGVGRWQPQAAYWDFPGSWCRTENEGQVSQDSFCQIPFCILMSPLWSSSIPEPECLAIVGQWV